MALPSPLKEPRDPNAARDWGHHHKGQQQGWTQDGQERLSLWAGREQVLYVLTCLPQWKELHRSRAALRFPTLPQCLEHCQVHSLHKRDRRVR